MASTTFAGESGAYGEVLLGNADTEITVSGVSDSEDDTSFGLRGGYKFTDYIAAELAYQNYGEAEDSGLSIETTALNFGAKGMLPINDIVSLNLRLGLSLWDSEISVSGIGSIDDNSADIYWGLGVDFNLTEQFKIGLEYSALNFDFEVGSGFEDFELDIANIALSLGINF